MLIFTNLFRKNTVATITAPLHSILTKLENHVAASFAKSEKLMEDSKKLVDRAIAHADEADAAKNVVKNIKSLLGVEEDKN